jgi:hypothetical protein
MGGAGNQVGNSSFAVQDGMLPYIGAAPTLTLSSEGRRSRFDLNYTFAAERYLSEHELDSTFHIFESRFTAQLGKRASLRLSDSLDTAPQVRVAGYASTAVTPEGFRYLYDPILAKRASLSNYARGDLQVDLGPKSFLVVGGSHSCRSYEKIAEEYGGLNDHTRAEGNLAWSRRTSSRQSVGLKYEFVENRVEGYVPARTQSATLVLTGEPSPTWSVSLEAGPAYSTSRSMDGEIGYVVYARLSKTIREANQFSFYYSHRPAENIGIGAISETHAAGAAFSRIFGRRVLLKLDLAAFDSRADLENAYDSRGLMGNALLGFVLGEHWIFGVGGSYQTREQATYGNLSYRRAYLLLRYSLPRLWRGSL